MGSFVSKYTKMVPMVPMVPRTISYLIFLLAPYPTFSLSKGGAVRYRNHGVWWSGVGIQVRATEPTEPTDRTLEISSGTL